MGTADPPSFDLSPREWLTVFPEPSRRRDPAGPARAASPLEPATFVAAVRARSRILAAMDLISLRLFRVAHLFTARYAAFSAACVAMVAPVLVFNEGRFGQRQVDAFLGNTAVMTAVSALWFLRTEILGGKAALSSILKVKGMYQEESGKKDDVEEPPAASSPLDTHPDAVVARWSQLAEFANADGEDGTQGSRLLVHDEDAPCPCPLPGCASRLFVIAAFQRLVTVAWIFIVFIPGYTVFLNWTSWVTFGAQTWTTAWSCALSIATVLVHLLYLGINPLAAVLSNPALLELSARLQHRALVLALDAFLDEQEKAADDAPPADGDKECYIRLQEHLQGSWQLSLDHISAGRSNPFIWILLQIVGMIVTISTGSCITMTQICCAVAPAGVIVNDLASIAVFNAGVARTSALCRSASSRLCLLALRRPSSPRLTAFVAHRGVLDGFAVRAEGFRGKFMGFGVGFGMIRALMAGTFAAGVGLASILRGSGIFVTVESVCPG
ncbi:hypothetical protein DFJ74DRAFT_769046 [Hyaloraphidium curvatum]|nr:hypothetical protein DFJ74DRAFT_769046 [Hyaloraphidium curvatum]